MEINAAEVVVKVEADAFFEPKPMKIQVEVLKKSTDVIAEVKNEPQATQSSQSQEKVQPKIEVEAMEVGGL